MVTDQQCFISLNVDDLRSTYNSLYLKYYTPTNSKLGLLLSFDRKNMHSLVDMY